MKIFNMPQRSPEWHQIRAGKLTSTGAAEMLATLKSGGEAAGRRNLRTRLALERITGRSLERGFQSQAMKDGNDREADAYAAYEAITGTMLESTGFVQSDDLDAGCSLDGHCGTGDRIDSIIEIKSPIHATHLEYLRTGKVPGDYLKQVTHALWITGAAFCDWMSYQPDFPEGLQTKIVRVYRTDVDLQAYELAARLFLSEVEKEVASIESLSVVTV